MPAMYHSRFGYATSTRLCMVTLLQNTAEHTPETENLRQKKITPSVIRNIGYGPVRGDKQPPINEGEK